LEGTLDNVAIGVELGPEFTKVEKLVAKEDEEKTVIKIPVIFRTLNQ
jgi:hypothetical protein